MSEQTAPGTEDRSTSRTARRLALLATSVWVAVLLIGLAYAYFISFLGDIGCDAAAGSSNFGHFSWSVFPPGPTCTYTADRNGLDSIVGPTPVMSIWLVALVVGGVATVALRRRARRLA